MVKKQTHIRVSIENKEYLEKKKRKLHLKSIDDVISFLRRKEEELEVLRGIKQKKKQRKERKSEIVPEKVKVKLPSLNGVCVYRHEREDGKIDCAKDFVETNVIHIVTREQCSKCWKNAIHEPISVNKNNFRKEFFLSYKV
ncbi:MAG: hypothetical protein J7L47_06195 [Candidatus Odinarchaeota archaeon]|nr:hypothetical protein [Candidatus Odinarchaeota archaeon]